MLRAVVGKAAELNAKVDAPLDGNAEVDDVSSSILLLVDEFSVSSQLDGDSLGVGVQGDAQANGLVELLGRDGAKLDLERDVLAALAMVILAAAIQLRAAQDGSVGIVSQDGLHGHVLLDGHGRDGRAEEGQGQKHNEGKETHVGGGWWLFDVAPTLKNNTE